MDNALVYQTQVYRYLSHVHEEEISSLTCLSDIIDKKKKKYRVSQMKER